MGENDVTSLRRLMEELERLKERYAGEPVAIEALEDVVCALLGTGRGGRNGRTD